MILFNTNVKINIQESNYAGNESITHIYDHRDNKQDDSIGDI